MLQKKLWGNEMTYVTNELDFKNQIVEAIKRDTKTTEVNKDYTYCKVIIKNDHKNSDKILKSEDEIYKALGLIYNKSDEIEKKVRIEINEIYKQYFDLSENGKFFYNDIIIDFNYYTAINCIKLISECKVKRHESYTAYYYAGCYSYDYMSPNYYRSTSDEDPPETIEIELKSDRDVSNEKEKEVNTSHSLSNAFYDLKLFHS